MAIPYALKILDLPMRDLSARYHLLLPSLGLSGWQRLYWLELRALRAPLMQSLAFAAVLSLGDFGIMALFGNQDFRTLPFYLYQQMGAYRHQESAVTALFLLLLSGVLFTVIERLATHHADSK
jgi:thiamine transport system permease protein